MRVNNFRPNRTRFLGGRLIHKSDLYASIYGIAFFVHFSKSKLYDITYQDFIALILVLAAAVVVSSLNAVSDKISLP